jgi:hypothetical protein
VRDSVAALAIVEQLHQEGLELKRAQLRRAHPSMNEEQIEQELREWILNRPFEYPGRVIKL